MAALGGAHHLSRLSKTLSAQRALIVEQRGYCAVNRKTNYAQCPGAIGFEHPGFDCSEPAQQGTAMCSSAAPHLRAGASQVLSSEQALIDAGAVFVGTPR